MNNYYNNNKLIVENKANWLIMLMMKLTIIEVDQKMPLKNLTRMVIKVRHHPIHRWD